MRDLKKAHSKLISKAKEPAGVNEVMKVYESFQQAYAVTEKYLQIVSPKSRQTNSNTSLLK